MVSTKSMARLAVSTLFIAGLAACTSTQPIDETPDADIIEQPSGSDVDSGTGSTGIDFGGVDDGSDGSLSVPAERTIYFDFDRAEVRSDVRSVLDGHAKYLSANPQARVIVEGHADERGTVEYNLALGEHRANSVKRYLTVQGVSSSQLEVVSFGEERPAKIGSGESSWAANRRVELVYQSY